MVTKHHPKILIIGGSGFLGKHLISTLSKSGYQLRIPTRNRERAKGHIIIIPDTELIQFDLGKNLEFGELFRGIDIVINCLGILHKIKKNDFDRFHIDLVRKIVNYCNKFNVERLIHVSALKASTSAASEYLRSKAHGESVIQRELSEDIKSHILRPSVIFGEDDSFLSMFKKLGDILPVIPLAMPCAKFQPVYVKDVVRCISNCIEGIEPRQEIDLCGPKQYELIELVRYATKFSRYPTVILKLPNLIAFAQAYIFEILKIRLLTRDNLYSMRVDSVGDVSICAEDSRALRAMEEIGPKYLSN